MKKTKLMALALASVFALVGCSGNDSGNGSQPASKEAASSDTIKLGGIIPQTGAVSNYGNSTENGIKLAIDEINGAGGIDGKEVVWTSYDDKGEITDATTAYNKLKDEGVTAIIGAITSKPSLAVAESASKDGIPVITPTGTQANITEGKANVFRQCFTDPYQGSLLSIFANENLKAKKVAILRNSSSDYSNGVSDEFIKKAEELGMEVVADESYGDNDTDFKAQLTTIANAKPEVLLIPDYYEKLALITPQARDAGITATFLGGDGWDGIIKVMDESKLGDIQDSYFTNHFSLQDEDEKVKEFIKNYNEKYGEDPTAFSALGYDSAYLLKQAIEEAKSTENEAVVEKMKSIDFNGITGSFKFDENNNPIKSASMIKVDNGEYKFDSIVDPN